MGAGGKHDHDRVEHEPGEPDRDMQPPAGGPDAVQVLEEANRGLQRANDEVRRLYERALETERALQASHADLERAQSVAKIGSWRLDTQRDALRWSDENYRIFGVPQGTLMTYEAFLECVHPDDRAYVHRKWTAALRGEPYDIEHRLLLAGGEIKWVREQADLELDERGALLGGIGTTQDITERKRLELELRLAEARSSGILSISADGIVSIDEDQRITMFNEGAEKMFGYSKAEALGAPLEILLPERSRAAHRGHVERFAAGREAARRMGDRGGVIHGRRKSGEEFPADAAISKLELDGRRVLTVAVRDVTEQKRAEDQLRQSQERFDLALRGADLAAWDWNIESGEVSFNARWAEMRGFRLEEIAPHESTWISCIHPDDWPRVQKALNDYFQGVVPEYQVEHRVRTRSGEWIWILDKGKVFARDEQGRPTRMVGTELDITERKRHEHAQRLLAEVGASFASTLEYEETLYNVARLVARDLADYCVVDVVEQEEVRRLRVECRDPSNAWVCDLLARLVLDRGRPHLLQPVLATGRPHLLERLSPEDLPPLSQSEEHLRALRAMNPRSVITVPLLAHGRLLGAMALVSAASSRVYGPADLRLAEEIGHRAALSIENARLFRAAGRAVQARDDVLGVVAHDLRNPLGIIRMQATSLQRLAPESDPRLRKAALAIERAATRMNRLIEDLLDVARIEAGRLSIEPSRVAAGQLVSDAAECQRALASSAAVELRIDAPEGLPEIWADRDRLLQVFENLVGNALRFTEPGGTVTLGAAQHDGGVVFRVADTGSGIAAEDLPHVFDRFWQARRPGRSGAGLGLAIVKGIVEAHGGNVWVESAPGRGSTFRFTIPAAPRASLGRSEPTPHSL